VNIPQSPHPSPQPTTPIVAAITITPASPRSDLPTPSPRRKSSFRDLSRVTRPTSLLQRGRSFTASDLQAAAEAPEPTLPSVPDASISHGNLTSSSASASTLAPPGLPVTRSGSRLVRAQSSSAISSHLNRAGLMSSRPSTSIRSVLAQPFPDSVSKPKTTSEWSDSEDERPTKSRIIPKNKKVTNVTKITSLIVGEDLLAGGALKSPFEEKELLF
jgi:hypothetical protein